MSFHARMPDRPIVQIYSQGSRAGATYKLYSQASQRILLTSPYPSSTSFTHDATYKLYLQALSNLLANPTCKLSDSPLVCLQTCFQGCCSLAFELSFESVGRHAFKLLTSSFLSSFSTHVKPTSSLILDSRRQKNIKL